MGNAVFTAGTLTEKAHKVPSFVYGEVGFTVTDTTTQQWKLFDIKGLNYIHVLIENVSASGAANRLDWGAIAFLHDSDTPSANSGKAVIAADTAVATTATAEFILAANAMDTTGETPVAPTIHEILPAARLQINLDAEGTDIITGNFWMVGNL
jgi:hypothetical protein